MDRGRRLAIAAICSLGFQRDGCAGSARQYVTPEDFGAKGDWNGVSGTDDTAALRKAFAASLYVKGTPGKCYLVTGANQIALRDGHVALGCGAEIHVASSATLSDVTGDGFFRYYNGIFAKTDNVALMTGITVAGWRVTSDCVNMGFLLMNSKAYRSGSAQLGPLSVSRNDVQLKSSGCGVLANDYALKAWKNAFRDTHYGIFAPGIYDGDVDSNQVEFSGVTRDYSTWLNTAAISCYSPKRTRIHDNIIYVTGGSALFASATVGDAQEVEIYRNRIIGAGLNGIATGVRQRSASTDTRHFDIWGNNITGFLCAPGSTLHSGISFNNEVSGVTIQDILIRDNYVDYCAPWESFDAASNQVCGSFNTMKSAGQTVGACYGVSIGSARAKILTARALGNVVDHFQGPGFVLNNIVFAEFSGRAYRTGWERNVANAPVQPLHPLLVQAVDHAVIREVTITEPFRGIAAADDTNAIPVRLRHCATVDLLRAVIQTVGNVSYPIRTDGPPGVALTLGTIVTDTLSAGGSFDGGNNALVYTAGSRITVYKAGQYLASQVTGSRTISHGVETISKATAAPVTTTLLNAADCPGLVLTLHYLNHAGGRWTINAATGDTINSISSLVMTQGESYILTSDGVNAWHAQKMP